jgi:hypothetical protein
VTLLAVGPTRAQVQPDPECYEQGQPCTDEARGRSCCIRGWLARCARLQLALRWAHHASPRTHSNDGRRLRGTTGKSLNHSDGPPHSVFGLKSFSDLGGPLAHPRIRRDGREGSG